MIYLTFLVVEPSLQRLEHSILGEGALQLDQVVDVGQLALLELLGQRLFPPPLLFRRRRQAVARGDRPQGAVRRRLGRRDGRRGMGGKVGRREGAGHVGGAGQGGRAGLHAGADVGVVVLLLLLSRGLCRHVCHVGKLASDAPQGGELIWGGEEKRKAN